MYGQACADRDTQEPIGSIPRPVDLIERVARGGIDDPNLAPLYEDAIRDTIERFEPQARPALRTASSGSTVISARTACMGFRTRARMVQNRVLRRS